MKGSHIVLSLPALYKCPHPCTVGYLHAHAGAHVRLTPQPRQGASSSQLADHHDRNNDAGSVPRCNPTETASGT